MKWRATKTSLRWNVRLSAGCDGPRKEIFNTSRSPIRECKMLVVWRAKEASLLPFSCKLHVTTRQEWVVHKWQLKVFFFFFFFFLGGGGAGGVKNPGKKLPLWDHPQVWSRCQFVVNYTTDAASRPRMIYKRVILKPRCQFFSQTEETSRISVNREPTQAAFARPSSSLILIARCRFLLGTDTASRLHDITQLGVSS